MILVFSFSLILMIPSGGPSHIVQQFHALAWPRTVSSAYALLKIRQIFIKLVNLLTFFI